MKGASDVSVVYPTSDPVLTLITCTNWDAENRQYLERLVVVAKPVASEPERNRRLERLAE